MEKRSGDHSSFSKKKKMKAVRGRLDYNVLIGSSQGKQGRRKRGLRAIGYQQFSDCSMLATKSY